MELWCVSSSAGQTQTASGAALACALGCDECAAEAGGLGLQRGGWPAGLLPWAGPGALGRRFGAISRQPASFHRASTVIARAGLARQGLTRLCRAWPGCRPNSPNHLAQLSTTAGYSLL
jgi:hypothetical protein